MKFLRNSENLSGITLAPALLSLELAVFVNGKSRNTANAQLRSDILHSSTLYLTI